MKLDLLTNATVVDDAIRFVSRKSKHKEKLNSSTNDSEYDKEGSNEPDYDEDQLEEEQEEETGEVTTNQVFDYLSKNTYLDLCHAYIGGQLDTSDITAVIRSEERGDFRDFIRTSHPPQRYGRYKARLELLNLFLIRSGLLSPYVSGAVEVYKCPSDLSIALKLSHVIQISQ